MQDTGAAATRPKRGREMYAIIQVSGRQWRVEPGTQLDVHRLPVDVGASHTVEHVLFVHDGQRVQIGCPYVPGAHVVCEVVTHELGPKVIAYHFRRRENWRKTVGHRQPLTKLVVKDIVLNGAQSAARKAASQTQAEPPQTKSRIQAGTTKHTKTSARIASKPSRQ